MNVDLRASRRGCRMRSGGDLLCDLKLRSLALVWSSSDSGDLSRRLSVRFSSRFGVSLKSFFSLF